MKRIMALLLAVVTCLSFIACSNDDSTLNTDSSERGTTNTNDSEETIEVTESQLINHPFLQFMYGEWEQQSDEAKECSPYSQLTVNKDGTCIIDGQSGTWEVSELSKEDYLIIDLFCGTEKVAGASFGLNIGFWALYADGEQAFTSSWEKMSEAVVDQNDIVLTTDNWRDYFELVTEPRYDKDAFGELDRLVLVQYIVLKDEYANNMLYTDVVAEIKSTANRYYITLDAANDSYILGDIVEECELSESIRWLRGYNGIYEIDIFSNNYIYANDNADPNSERSKYVILVNDINDIEFLRVKGAIYIKNQ